ncbi:MAG TPA: hypothetical protein ENK06_06465, partial [Gammaproteobacteria bacterium]|nr:hypothetical protein [Gammaproteobacteria bacterium]
MAKSNDGDPWKRHLVEAEAELEEKTQQLQDTQVFFCSVIARLAHLLKDDISPFRAEIDAIKDAAKNASDLTILKSSVESLTTKIIRSDEVSLKNDSSALVPGSELQTLLEKVVELDAGSEQLQEVRQRVANISSASELAIALDDVALIWKQSVVKQTT